MNIKEIDVTEFQEVCLEKAKEMNAISNEIKRVENLIKDSPFCSETFEYTWKPSYECSPNAYFKLIWCGEDKSLCFQECILGVSVFSRRLIECKFRYREEAFNHMQSFLDMIINQMTQTKEEE